MPPTIAMGNFLMPLCCAAAKRRLVQKPPVDLICYYGSSVQSHSKNLEGKISPVLELLPLRKLELQSTILKARIFILKI